MKNTRMMLGSKKDSAERRLRSNIEEWQVRLPRLLKALNNGSEADVSFLQHAASMAEDAATYNAIRDAMAMMDAETRLEEKADR